MALAWKEGKNRRRKERQKTKTAKAESAAIELHKGSEEEERILYFPGERGTPISLSILTKNTS